MLWPVRTRVRAGVGRRACRRAGQPDFGRGLSKEGRGPNKRKTIFSLSFLSQIHSNEILDLFKTFSKLGPKTKVAQYFILYNIAKRS
jgi:hypothetical protein